MYIVCLLAPLLLSVLFPMTLASGRGGTVSDVELARTHGETYGEHIRKAFAERRKYNQLAVQEDRPNPSVSTDDPERSKHYEEALKQQEMADKAFKAHQKLSENNKDIEPLKEYLPSDVEKKIRKQEQKAAKRQSKSGPPAKKRRKTESPAKANANGGFEARKTRSGPK